jgi:hypothetical protein
MAANPALTRHAAASRARPRRQPAAWPQRTESIIRALLRIPGRPRDPGRCLRHHCPDAQNSLICIPLAVIVIDYRRSTERRLWCASLVAGGAHGP